MRDETLSMSALLSEADMKIIAAVRGDRKLNPLSGGFNWKRWTSCVTQNPPSTDRERAFCSLVEWFAVNASALRDLAPHKGLGRLSKKDATASAVACINREYSELQSQVSSGQRKIAKRGGKEFSYSIRSALTSKGSGDIDPDGLVSAAVDALSNMLFDVGRLPASEERLEVPRAAYFALQTYARQRLITDLWQNALWAGWGLAFGNSKPLYRPAYEGLEQVKLAWDVRRQSLLTQEVMQASYEWMHEFKKIDRLSSLTTKSVSSDSKANFIVISKGAIASKLKPPHQFLQRRVLDKFYVKNFLNVSVGESGINLEYVFDCWSVLMDLSEVLVDRAGSTTVKTRESVWGWACRISRVNLINVLARATETSTEKAEKAVEFLTYTLNKRRGVWGFPIIPIPDTQHVALVAPALLIDNPIRRVEIWLNELGVSDDIESGNIGTVFEKKFRRDLKAIIDKNECLSESEVYQGAIKKSDVFGEEIDALVKIGSALAVVEVKCFLTPADPIEFYYFYKKLLSASFQAKRKCKAVISQRNRIGNYFSGEIETIFPLVVLSSASGAGIVVDDCPVVDEAFLKLYCSGGKMTEAAAMNLKTGDVAGSVHTFYDSEAAAASRFLACMSSPRPMRKLLSRIKPGTVCFGPDSSLEIYTPRLDDYTGEASVLAAEMARAVRG